MPGILMANVRGSSALADARTLGNAMRPLERVIAGIHGHHIIRHRTSALLRPPKVVQMVLMSDEANATGGNPAPTTSRFTLREQLHGPVRRGLARHGPPESDRGDRLQHVRTERVSRRFMAGPGYRDDQGGLPGAGRRAQRAPLLSHGQDLDRRSRPGYLR